MKKTLILFTLLFTILSFGQSPNKFEAVDAKMIIIPARSAVSTDGIASYINDNFNSESDKIRAAFFWTASNISYDVSNMYSVKYDETVQDKIARTLKSKKGVCSNYAQVLNDITKKIGIQSHIIESYNKQNGKITNLAHAWTAAKVDNKWYLFDATWGSGYVNNGRFSKKLNNAYFKADPNQLISSHIPFDYLWQFLNYPITNGEFYEGKVQINKSKKYFDFDKEIARYNSLPETDQLFESAQRIEKNGLKNAMIVERYEFKKGKLASIRKNNNIDKLNALVNEMNYAVAMLNDFIHYRNNKFKPTFSDNEISNMIAAPKEKLLKCQKEIYEIGDVGSANAANFSLIKKTLNKTLAQAEEHDAFVKEYLGKSKLIRKTMFSKMSFATSRSK